MQELVLIRGLPGSGKSTLARAMDGFVHYEADMSFMSDDGVYRFDPARLKDAHESCQYKTRRALLAGKSVVVSNTFTRLIEMDPYFTMAAALNVPVRVIIATGTWKSVHNVPERTIQAMAKRWETLDDY